MAQRFPDDLDGSISRAEASWLLAVTFAGLGTGFIMLILTLSMLNAVALCALGMMFVWPLAKNKNKDSHFALKSSGIYFASCIVGVAVGWSSTFGTGLPVVSVLSLFA